MMLRLNDLEDADAEPALASGHDAVIDAEQAVDEMFTPVMPEAGGEFDVPTSALPSSPTQPRRDLIPAPGMVIVLRNDICPYLQNADGSPMLGINNQPMPKSQQQIDDEDRSNVEAVIGRVGDDDLAGNRTAWFSAGDEVVIAPHVFTEVVLNAGRDGTVWLGPFAGVKAKFIDALDAEVADAP